MLPTHWVSPAAVCGTAQPRLASRSPAAASSLRFRHIMDTLLGDPLGWPRLVEAIYDSLYPTNCS